MMMDIHQWTEEDVNLQTQYLLMQFKIKQK